MSKTNVWLPLHVGDYMADTPDLTTVEHGAYLLLLMAHWRTGDLPDDDLKLARIAKLRLDHWRKIAPTVRAFFKQGDRPGTLRQKRLHAERLKAQQLSNKRADAARGRWAKSGCEHAENGGGELAANALNNHDTADASAASLQPVCIVPPPPHKEGLRPSGGKPPGGGRRKGPKQPGLALGNGADVPEPDARPEPNPAKAIYVEGAALVSEMIGADARWLIAKMLNAAGKDAARVLAVIREAHARHTSPGGCLDNPTAYLLWKAKPGSDAAAVPEAVNGWPVAETAAYCRSVAQVEKEHWPGLEGAIADVLAHGANPDAHIYPVMRATISKNPNMIGVGLLVTSIRERMKAAPPVRDAA